MTGKAETCREEGTWIYWPKDAEDGTRRKEEDQKEHFGI